MDALADRLVERPGALTLRSTALARALRDATGGVGTGVHGVGGRWSPARSGSGEPDDAQARLPGRSPAQPLGSSLIHGASGRTCRLQDRGPAGGAGRGPGPGLSGGSA